MKHNAAGMGIIKVSKEKKWKINIVLYKMGESFMHLNGTTHDALFAINSLNEIYTCMARVLKGSEWNLSNLTPDAVNR